MRQTPDLNGIIKYLSPHYITSGADVQVPSLPDRTRCERSSQTHQHLPGSIQPCTRTLQLRSKGQQTNVHPPPRQTPRVETQVELVENSQLEMLADGRPTHLLQSEYPQVTHVQGIQGWEAQVEVTARVPKYRVQPIRF